MIMATFNIKREEVLDAVQPAGSEAINQLVNFIFDLPMKGSRVSKDLKHMLKLADRIDEEEFEELVFGEDEDAVDKVFDKASLILEHGQGITTHDVARLELLMDLLTAIVSCSSFDVFRQTAHKWLNIVANNNYS